MTLLTLISIPYLLLLVLCPPITLVLAVASHPPSFSSPFCQGGHVHRMGCRWPHRHLEHRSRRFHLNGRESDALVGLRRGWRAEGRGSSGDDGMILFSLSALLLR